MPASRLGTRAARRGARRHGGRDAPQHSRHGGTALRPGDDRRGREHPQHAPGRGGDRVHARPRRGEGALHGSRVLRDGRAGARVVQVEAGRDRRRRRDARGRDIPGREGVRGVPRGRHGGLRVDLPARRVGRHLAQLHFRHDGQPQGRRLSLPRRVPERDQQHPRLVDAEAPRLSVDAADVPLQRLVLQLDRGRGSRHQRVPAQGRREADPRPHPRPPRDPLLRRANRALDAHERACRLEEGHRPHGALPGRGRPAAGRRDRGHGAHRLRHHARVRAHGDLRAGGGLRQASRVGGARAGGAGAAQRPPGRGLPAGGGHDGARSADDGAGALGRRDHGRDHVPRQHHHEGLPQEPEGHGRGVPRRLVPLGRPGRDAARRVREDQGPLQGRDHLRRREHLLAGGRGRALRPSGGDARGGGRAARSPSGARRLAPSSS